jgi:hypothetical protein
MNGKAFAPQSDRAPTNRVGTGVERYGGGTLASPRASSHTLLRLALHRTRHACAVSTASSGRRKRPYAHALCAAAPQVVSAETYP